MKQSVDLMNSMKRFSFRHSNSGTYSTRRTYSTAPTSLARRALLLFSILSMGVGNVWGQITTWNTEGTLAPGVKPITIYQRVQTNTIFIILEEHGKLHLMSFLVLLTKSMNIHQNLLTIILLNVLFQKMPLL